jgi:nucleoside-triphosphatase
MTKNILLTGLPGSGKTTVIRKLSEIFKEFNPAGFYTGEIREDGLQTGSFVAPLFGDSRVFSHTTVKSKYAVGRFRVDVKGFDMMLESVFARDKKTGLYLIDEIGKMECLSKKFCKYIMEFLDSERPVVAAIADKGTGIITEIRKRNDVELHEVNPENHDLTLKELTMEIRDLLLE